MCSGGVRFALPALAVRQVVQMPALHPVPGSKAHLLGLAQISGEPLAVLDIYALLAGGPAGVAPRTTVVLGRGEDGRRSVLGLAVDEVEAMAAISRMTEVEEAGGLVAGRADFEGGQVQILDPSVLFSDDWDLPDEEHVWLK